MNAKLNEAQACRDETDGFGLCECACHEPTEWTVVLSEADETCLALNRAPFR